jgi:hypothetical protein
MALLRQPAKDTSLEPWFSEEGAVWLPFFIAEQMGV